MIDAPPTDPAEHAQEFARCWVDRLDEYCAVRMEELGVPEDLFGADDLRPHMKWCAFDPEGREGGRISKGVTVNSGALNPDLLRGGKGGHIWPKARLKHRIDAIIAHELEEYRHGSHVGALRAAAKTELPITDGARRILRAMGR